MLDWAVVVPVKGGSTAKSRLAAQHRPRLAIAFAVDTIATAVATVGPSRTVVVTSSDVVCRALTSLGPLTVVPDPGAGLDAAAAAGVQRAVEGTSPPVGCAVLLGDHPCLTPTELAAALAAAARHTHAFVPDAAGSGSAMVTTTDPPDFRSAFGRDSARRHEALGLHRLDLDLPGLRLDVDDLTDLQAALELGVGPRTRDVLLGYAAERAGEHPHDQ